MNNSTHPITTFVELMMIKYHSIFPTVESVIQHILIVNGNGFYFDDLTGMIYTKDDNNDKQFINEYSAFSSKQAKTDLIERQYQTELTQEINHNKRFDFDSPIKSRITRAPDVTIIDSMLQRISILSDIRLIKPVKQNRYDAGIVRPYPISNYSFITKLNMMTPIWLIDLAIEYSFAWLEFIRENSMNANDELVSVENAPMYNLKLELEVQIIRLSELPTLTTLH